MPRLKPRLLKHDLPIHGNLFVPNKTASDAMESLAEAMHVGSECREGIDRPYLPPVRVGLSGRDSRKALATLSELSLEFPSRCTTQNLQTILLEAMFLKPPEHVQPSLLLSTAGKQASFFRSGSAEGRPQSWSKGVPSQY